MWSVQEGISSEIQVSLKKFDGVSKGDFVELSGKRRAIVHYIGPLQNKKKDTWFGCELEFPRGRNNGTLDGVEYFKCRPDFGVFVTRKKISKVLLRANHPRIEKVYKRARSASRERALRKARMRDAKKAKAGGKTFFDVEDFVSSSDENTTRRKRSSTTRRGRSPTTKRTTSGKSPRSPTSKRAAGNRTASSSKRSPKSTKQKKRTPASSLERKRKQQQEADLKRLASTLKGLKIDIRLTKKRTPDASAEAGSEDEARRESVITRLPSRQSLAIAQAKYENLEVAPGSLTPTIASTEVEKELRMNALKVMQPIPGFVSPIAGTDSLSQTLDWNSPVMMPRSPSMDDTLEKDFEAPSWPTQMTIQEGSVSDAPDQADAPWLWNSSQVSSWLLNFEEVRQYAVLFVAHDVTGEELLEMRPTDLQRLGVTNEGDLDKILQYIEHLKRFSELSTSLDNTRSSGRTVGKSGSIRQLNLNRELGETESDDRVPEIVTNASGKFQRKYLKNIDNDFLTQEMMRIGETTYEVALGRLEESSLSEFLRNQESVVMAAVSEPSNNTRQICFEGSRSEIVRARELLMKRGFLPKLDKEDWFDVLEDALESGDVLEITQLLGQGMYKELNDTELLQSATIGQDTMTQTSLALMMFLLERLPTLNLKDSSGISLVSMFCGAEGRPPVPELVRYLINENVALSIEDDEGLTPLFHATMVGHIDVVDMLLNSGELSVNAQSKMGDTALMFASGLRAQRDESSEPNLDLMRHLIEKHSVNINHQNSDGVSALMVSAGFVGFGYGLKPIYVEPDPEAVSLLIRSKADVNLSDGAGRTALHYASESGNEDIVTILQENGAG